LGFGSEIGDDTVHEYRFDNGINVLAAYHVASTESGVSLCTQNEVLNGSGTSAPGNVFFDPFRRGFQFGPSGSDEFDNVIKEMFRDRNSAYEVLEEEDLFS
jgi:hypothetical protein